MGGRFVQRVWRLDLPAHHLRQLVLRNGSLGDTRFWQRCGDRWIANTTMRGGWQGSRAMQLMFVLGLEHALSRLDNASLKECTRTGLQDDMTFVGSAARLNGAWDELEATLARAGHWLRNCAPGYEQFEDLALPDAIRGLCMKLPRQRLWHSALGFGCELSIHNASWPGAR